MAIVASGTIADRPFGRTVAAIAQRRFTGELRLRAAAGGTWTIGWRDGYVVAAAGAHPADGAVKTALGAGLISSTQASEVLRALAPGVDDVAVVGERARLGPDQLARLRRRVVANRAMRLFAIDAGEFDLDDALTLPVAPDLVPLDPRLVVYLGVRAHYDDDRLLRELAALGDTFRLRDGEVPTDAFGFGDAERPAIDVLARRSFGARALVQAAPEVDGHVALAALYALAVTGYCEIGGARAGRATISPPGGIPAAALAAQVAQATAPARRSRPTTGPHPRAEEVAPVEPVAPPSAQPPPGSIVRRGGRTARGTPPHKRADADKIRALVQARLAAVDGGVDHFALLGVTPETPPDKVRAAYFEIARQLHPDRITATGLDEIRADAQRLFAQINAAFAVLSHPGRRHEYTQTLRAGGADAVRRREEEAERQAERILSAEEHFRTGEMALRRQQLDTAIAEFERAVELNPDEPEHHALLAWARWCAAADKVAAAKVARAALDRAARSSGKNPTPHLYLGKIARGLNEDAAAAAHFRRVLELFPDHGEATSELRVLEARLAAAPPDEPPRKGGLFGRFRRDSKS